MNNTTSTLDFAFDILHKELQQSFDRLVQWDIRLIEDQTARESIQRARGYEQDRYDSINYALRVLADKEAGETV